MRLPMLCHLNFTCNVGKTKILLAGWHYDVQVTILANQSDGKKKLVMEEEIFGKKSRRYRQFRINIFTFWAILWWTGMWISLQNQDTLKYPLFNQKNCVKLCVPKKCHQLYLCYDSENLLLKCSISHLVLNLKNWIVLSQCCKWQTWSSMVSRPMWKLTRIYLGADA